MSWMSWLCSNYIDDALADYCKATKLSLSFTTIMRLSLIATLLGIASARVLDYKPNYEKLSARQEASAAYEGYMFAYFTGNSVAGEKIYFAASNGNNALDWTELNGGQPALTSTKGTKGLRDPFIIRSHGVYRPLHDLMTYLLIIA